MGENGVIISLTRATHLINPKRKVYFKLSKIMLGSTVKATYVKGSDTKLPCKF